MLAIFELYLCLIMQNKSISLVWEYLDLGQEMECNDLSEMSPIISGLYGKSTSLGSGF